MLRQASALGVFIIAVLLFFSVNAAAEEHKHQIPVDGFQDIPLEHKDWGTYRIELESSTQALNLFIVVWEDYYDHWLGDGNHNASRILFQAYDVNVGVWNYQLPNDEDLFVLLVENTGTTAAGCRLLLTKYDPLDMACCLILAVQLLLIVTLFLGIVLSGKRKKALR